jgi:hypothetical protein
MMVYYSRVWTRISEHFPAGIYFGISLHRTTGSTLVLIPVLVLLSS